MIVFKTNFEKIKHEDLNLQNLDPKFRRATQNIIGSTFVCQKILTTNTIPITEKLGFIYATHFGEMDSSMQYLSFLNQEKFGRPILFQNSLHNSTLGFVSIDLKIEGPCLTISGDDHMNESILNACEGLLYLCDFVLICLSESIPKKYIELYSTAFPSVIPHFNQSQAMLISKNQFNNSVPVNLMNLKLI